MPKYEVQIGRNVRTYYTATVEADSVEDLARRVSEEDFESLATDWKKGGADEPETVEVANIADQETDTIVGRWTEEDGWDPEHGYCPEYI